MWKAACAALRSSLHHLPCHATSPLDAKHTGLILLEESPPEVLSLHLHKLIILTAADKLSCIIEVVKNKDVFTQLLVFA